MLNEQSNRRFKDMDKREHLRKYIEEKADKYAMAGIKVQDSDPQIDNLVYRLAKASFTRGFCQALESMGELSSILESDKD